jgi:hypothetical protein
LTGVAYEIILVIRPEMVQRAGSVSRANSTRIHVTSRIRIAAVVCQTSLRITTDLIPINVTMEGIDSFAGGCCAIVTIVAVSLITGFIRHTALRLGAGSEAAIEHKAGPVVEGLAGSAVG